METQGQSAYDNAMSKFTLSCSSDCVNWILNGKVFDGS